jgi:hypothetical protein
MIGQVDRTKQVPVTGQNRLCLNFPAAQLTFTNRIQKPSHA